MAAFYSVYSAEKIPALASALGDMLLAWTQAEEAQVWAMASMLKIDLNDCLRVYQRLPNFRSRTQMLYLLIELYPEYEPIRSPVAGLSKLSKTRNRYVHGGFIQNIDVKTDIRSIDYTEAPESKERAKPVKPADIVNHSNAVRRRAQELEEALAEVPSHIDWLEVPLRIDSTGPGLVSAQEAARAHVQSSK